MSRQTRLSSQAAPSGPDGARVSVLVLVRLIRRVAAELVIASHLRRGQHGPSLEVGTKVNDPELALQAGDPRHAHPQIGLRDRRGAEGSFELFLLAEDLCAEPAGVTPHRVEDFLELTHLIGA